MELFDVARGRRKETSGNGGLAGLLGEIYAGSAASVEILNADPDNVVLCDPDYLPRVHVHYDARGLLAVDGEQIKPDFNDKEAMQRAMASRGRWTGFLDQATGYDAKKRGDKAKERVKRRAKAMSRINEWRGFLEKISGIDDKVRADGDDYAAQIEEALADEDIGTAHRFAEKLAKMMG